MHKDDLEGAEFSSKYQNLLGIAHDRVRAQNARDRIARVKAGESRCNVSLLTMTGSAKKQCCDVTSGQRELKCANDEQENTTENQEDDSSRSK